MQPIVRSLIAVATLFVASFAHAQDYPTRPIRLVVPFAAGGGADAVARIVAKRVSETIGQPMVVENKPGAGGNVAGEAVAAATPDGYTLLFGGATSINMAVFKDVRYDLLTDFVPITMTTIYPYVLVVNKNLGVNNLKELVALAKQKPLKYGSAGVGTAPHLTGELFASRVGIKLTHIPYRGTALAMTDLLGGQVEMVFGDPITLLAQINAGTVKAIAVTSPERSPAAPDIPTVAESGYPGFDASAWHGILAPAKTPPDIVRKLNTELAAALNDPGVKGLLGKQAMSTVGDSSESFGAFLKKDVALWKKVASDNNIYVQQ